MFVFARQANTEFASGRGLPCENKLFLFSRLSTWPPSDKGVLFHEIETVMSSLPTGT